MDRITIAAAHAARTHLSATNVYAHTEQVAARVTQLCRRAGWSDIDTDYAVAAAWLHDIGHAPALTDTGIHAIDGARWARSVPLFESFAPSIAWHSLSEWETAEAGIDLAAEFSRPSQMMHSLLWIADFTTTPTGEVTTLIERVAALTRQHAPGTARRRALDASLPSLLAAADRVDPTSARHLERSRALA